MSRMYTILLAMKYKFDRADWLQMVEQAHQRGKITDAERAALIAEDVR